jgi:glycosyltransferase involved in cell wall biosynthesis
MDFSILICTRNRHDKLLRCIHSLQEADLGNSSEIVIVDQSDQALELETSANLRYYWRKGKGLAKARNEAIRLANGDIVAFTDDDCLVTRDWLSNIQATFEAYPEAVGVFGRVMAYSAENEQVVHQHKNTLFGEITFAEKPGPYICPGLFARQTVSIHNQPCMPYANLGGGNNMAFRRSIFDQHGGFITQLGVGTWLRSAEDTEFHYRLLRASCTLVYTPQALVLHDSWIDMQQYAERQDNYRIGGVATWCYYSLKGDQLAFSFLKHRWRGVSREILDNRSGKGPIERVKFMLKKRGSFFKGIVGGLVIYLLSLLRPARLYQ